MDAAVLDKSRIQPDDASHAKDWGRFTKGKKLVLAPVAIPAPLAIPAIPKDGYRADTTISP
jgi:hypothetical protein